MPAIEVHALHKRYAETIAVRDVSFTVEEGEVFGILGPNGAGKTTTVECVQGLRRPDGGTVRVLGLDPQTDRRRVREVVGSQLQSSALPERITAIEALRMYASFYRDPADPEELLDRLGLADKRTTRFGALSGGQKQRLSVAMALVGNPRVAILDELTTGLDPQARRDTWELVEQIRDRGVTVLLVTHFMEEAERLCDRIALIDAGSVVALDTPAALVDRVQGEQVVRFRLPEDADLAWLAAAPAVSELTRRRTDVRVSGDEDLLRTVVVGLADRELRPRDLRTERSTLDDAFLALTGRRIATSNGGPAGDADRVTDDVDAPTRTTATGAVAAGATTPKES